MNKLKTDRSKLYFEHFFKFCFIFFIFFIFASLVSIFLFNSRDTIISWSGEYPGQWYYSDSDGNTNSYEIGRYLDVNNNCISINSIIPDSIKDDSVIGFYAYSGASIYIDDELVASFDERENPFHGINVKKVFIQTTISRSNSGSVLKFVMNSDGEKTRFRQIFYGDSFGIFKSIFKENGIQFCLGIFLLFISLIICLASVCVQFSYGEWKSVLALGIGFVCISLWIITDNVLFQYLFGIYFIDGYLEYLISMIMIIPFLYHVNYLQSNRYQKILFIVGIILSINFVIISILHFADIINFMDSRPVMNVILGASVLLILFTLIADLIRGYVRDYPFVFIGVASLCVFGIAETLYVNFKANANNGFFILGGLYSSLALSVIQMFYSIRISREKEFKAVNASRMKSEFLASMSHEIRTPINAIMGMNEMIMRESNDREIKYYSENIMHASNNLLALINDILDFSKIEAGRFDLVEREYSFGSLFFDVITMMDIKAKNKDLLLNYNIDKNLPDCLYGDDVKIRQIIINIINNAIKYTHEGSVTVTVKGSMDEKKEFVHLYIDVTDTGIGIKENDREKLFNKFNRLDMKNNADIEGTGLGLAICKSFSDMMNGTIDVKSIYGKGSSFIFELDQKVISDVSIEAVEGSITKDKKEDEYKPLKVVSDSRILVVDDVEMNLVVIEGLLKQSGINIDTADCGMSALELIAKNRYDIILMDHMMPEMDGIEVLNKMKANKSHPNQNTPVIILTANAIVGAENEYINYGFTDYLSKPVDGKTLELMLRKYLPSELIV